MIIVSVMLQIFNLMSMNLWIMSKEMYDLVLFKDTHHLSVHQFECCGVFSPEDWLDTPYFKMEGFPESCDCSNGGCVIIESTSVYDRVKLHYMINLLCFIIQGCNESFFDFIQTNAAAIGGVGLSFGLLEVCMSILFLSLYDYDHQIVGVVIGFILCCCIFKKRNSEDYWTK